jgi:cytochrome b561
MNTSTRPSPPSLPSRSFGLSEPALLQPTRRRHAAATIALHWASAGLIAVSAAAALARELTENEALRGPLLDIHRQTGLLVMLALALRLAVRWRAGQANHAGRLHPLLQWAAHGAHLALYAMLLALPALGIATSQAHEVTVRLFGLWAVPVFVPADPDLAEQFSDWHIRGAWALLALVGAHVAAALWHHLVRRDGVLSAMLPLLRRRA